jgi:biotin operon repressor
MSGCKEREKVLRSLRKDGYEIVKDAEGNSYAVPRLQPAEGWAAAWDEPNEDHFIIGSIFHSTRRECWDDLLTVWYLRSTDGTYCLGKRTHDLKFVSRHTAIKTLRRRGLRVLRVQVQAV